MNDIKQYFSSPQKHNADSVAARPIVEVVAEPSKSTTVAAAVVVASISADDKKCMPSSPSSSANRKLIVSNMEAVISSVKKKHKAKRKVREKTTGEPEICDISDILSSSLRFVSPNVSGSIRGEDEAPGAGDKDQAEAGKSKSSDEEDVVNVDEIAKPKAAITPKKSTPMCLLSPHKTKPIKTSSRSSKENKPSASRLTNPKTPSKTPTTPKKSLFTATAPQATTTPSQSDGKPKNAFELMMNARNKSIGSNSPGKDASPLPMSPSTSDASPITSIKTKRKLMLEAWADQKGAAKRKMQDVETDEYISHQMEKRAKRLKKLLKNGSKDTDGETLIEVLIDDDEDPEPSSSAASADTPSLNGTIKLNFKKSSKVQSGKVKRNRLKLKVYDSDDEEMAVDDQQPVVEITLIKTEVPRKPSPSTLQKNEVTTTTPRKSNSSRKPRRKIRTAPKTPTKTVSPKTPTKSPRPSKSPKCDDIVLSSPIKKRDSLLGYFNKVEKSPTLDEVVQLVEVIPVPDPESIPLDFPELVTLVPKRRGRPKKTAQMPKTPIIQISSRETTPSPSGCRETESNDFVEVILSVRPKRGCRDKQVAYKIDTDSSPAKVAAQKSLKRARRLLSGGGSPQKSPGKSPRLSQKLAPIFVKAPVKQLVDPEVSKARQQFLMSGIPERMKLDIERQRLFEQSYECELDLFPSVSHVTQLKPQPNEDENAFPILSFREEDADESTFDTRKPFKLGTLDRPTPPAKRPLPNVDDTKLVKPKDLVKYLKDIDSDKFLYFRCYKQLSKKYKCDQEPLQKMAMSNVIVDQSSSNDSIEFVEQVFGHQNGTEMFTEKYKPMSPEEIVVNSGPAYQLKKFLSTWQENYQQQNQRNRKQYASLNEDDDFEIESNSTSSLNKSIILLGPTGNGKTNAVYALAKEMNFKVLEINAGNKRTGKKILLELQEATQSHQVKGSGTEKLFRGSQAPSSEESSSGFGTSSQSTQKLSLILIEDADIVFEQDNGFVDAIHQLVATSKRPVILIANQHNCPHLLRFISSNSIVFANANEIHAGKWLSMMSIAERVYVGHEECQRLYVHNGFDMRRTILEMQFFLQSGGDRERFEGSEETHFLHQTLYDSFTKNQNDTRVVSYPVEFGSIHTKTEAILKGGGSDTNRGTSLDDVLDYYQTVSTAQSIQSRRHVEDDGLKSNLSEEIAHFLVEGAIVRMQSPRFCIDPPVKNPVTVARQLLSTGIYTGFSAVTHVSRRSSINLDVEPCLRAICRTEKIRTQTERRSSRFYHYLRNAVTSSFSTDAFDEHCTVLSDSHNIPESNEVAKSTEKPAS